MARAMSMLGITFETNSWRERMTTSGEPANSTLASPYLTEMWRSLSLDIRGAPIHGGLKSVWFSGRQFVENRLVLGLVQSREGRPRRIDELPVLGLEPPQLGRLGQPQERDGH